MHAWDHFGVFLAAGGHGSQAPGRYSSKSPRAAVPSLSGFIRGLCGSMTDRRGMETVGQSEIGPVELRGAWFRVVFGGFHMRVSCSGRPPGAGGGFRSSAERPWFGSRSQAQKQRQGGSCPGEFYIGSAGSRVMRWIFYCRMARLDNGASRHIKKLKRLPEVERRP